MLQEDVKPFDFVSVQYLREKYSCLEAERRPNLIFYIWNLDKISKLSPEMSLEDKDSSVNARGWGFRREMHKNVICNSLLRTYFFVELRHNRGALFPQDI